MTPLGFARLYNSPKPYCSPSIIIQGNFHLFKYPRERFDTFFAIFFADSKSRAQELSNDVSFVIFGYQTLDLEGGGGKLTPPDVSWFSSTPAGIGLRNYCVFYFIILTHFMVISIINVLKSNHRAIKFNYLYIIAPDRHMCYKVLIGSRIFSEKIGYFQNTFLI